MRDSCLAGNLLELLAQIHDRVADPLVFFIVTTMGIKPSPSGDTFRFFSYALWR